MSSRGTQGCPSSLPLGCNVWGALAAMQVLIQGAGMGPKSVPS